MLDLEPALGRLAFEMEDLSRAMKLPVSRGARWRLEAALAGVSMAIRDADPNRQYAIKLNGMARRYMLDAEYRKQIDNGKLPAED